MFKRWFPCLLLALAAPLGAAPIIQFHAVPDSFVPGEPIEFEVRLISPDVGSYNIELILSGSEGVAGTDYYFEWADRAPSQYVFMGVDDGHFLAAIQSATSRDRLTLSDFLNAGDVDAFAGVNDRVAVVGLRTSPAFDGTLALTVNPASLELFDGNLDDVPGLAEVVVPEATLAVPEPGLLAGLGALGAMLALRPRAARRR